MRGMGRGEGVEEEEASSNVDEHPSLLFIQSFLLSSLLPSSLLSHSVKWDMMQGLDGWWRKSDHSFNLFSPPFSQFSNQSLHRSCLARGALHLTPPIPFSTHLIPPLFSTLQLWLMEWSLILYSQRTARSNPFALVVSRGRMDGMRER